MRDGEQQTHSLRLLFVVVREQAADVRVCLFLPLEVPALRIAYLYSEQVLFDVLEVKLFLSIVQLEAERLFYAHLGYLQGNYLADAQSL